MSYTPGPWKVWPVNNRLMVGTVSPQIGYEGVGYHVCSTTGNSVVDQSNALLIAAAPELLAACKKVLSLLRIRPTAQKPFPEHFEEMVKMVTVAIAHAVADALLTEREERQ